MAKFNKIPYKCIIYDVGDIVYPKYPNDFSKPKEIIGYRLDVVGANCITQFLKFSDEEDDLNISNHFVPYGDVTRNKYADGLNYYQDYNTTTGEILVTKGKTQITPIEKKKVEKDKSKTTTTVQTTFTIKRNQTP